MQTLMLGAEVEVVTGPQAGDGFRIQVERGHDGALVVNIETQGLGETDVDEEGVPKMRLYVNEGCVWEEAAPYSHPDEDEEEVRALHTKDEECDVDPATDLCRGCGVHHGEPCPVCAGRGFHTPESQCLRLMVAAGA
jgi:hypothetical protein